MIKKVLKIVVTSIIIVAIVAVGSMLPSESNSVSAASKARTLKELRAELQALKDEYNKNESDKKATKNEINKAENSVTNKQNEIVANQGKISAATEETAALEVEIQEGKDSISRLMQAYQYASGNNVYLEYIFDAENYEDLIYRYAVIEEIMEYQEDQIASWKDKIAENDALKQELADREVLLENQIDSLSKEISNLGNKLDGFMDISMDIKDEIKSTEELIEYYEDIGCGETEDLEACVNVRGDTRFIKPLVKGRITSHFGYRTDPITGKKGSFHSGTDIGGNKEGTSVYSIANGTVGKIIRKSSCGGNQVYVHHIINGKKYTSAYLHLLSIKVKVGDKVSNTTVVGTVGGGRQTTWDNCSTGAHLHLGLGTGWYGADYTTYSKWVSHLVDAAEVLKLPKLGVYWYSR